MSLSLLSPLNFTPATQATPVFKPMPAHIPSDDVASLMPYDYFDSALKGSAVPAGLSVSGSDGFVPGSAGDVPVSPISMQAELHRQIASRVAGKMSGQERIMHDVARQLAEREKIEQRTVEILYDLGFSKEKLPTTEDHRQLAARVVKKLEKDQGFARDILSKAEIKKRVLETLRKLGVVGGPDALRPDVCEFEIEIYRAQGADLPDKPTWHSKEPLSSAAPEIQLVYENFRRLWEYSNKLWSDNKVLQTLYPQGLNFCRGKFIVVVDLDPSNGADEEGYANAYMKRGEKGEIILVLGKGPKPGSEASKIFRPVGDDASVYSHEFGHAYIDAMFALFNSSIEYVFHPGAGWHESSADIFAVAARQALWLGGRMLVDAPDSNDYKIGEVFIVDGALRDVLNPGQARGKNHPFGNDRQQGDHSKVDYTDPVTQAILSRDHGGVHELNSIGNRAGGLTAVRYGGDAQKMLHIRLGALALAAAAAPEKRFGSASYFEQAQLHVASAYLLYGEDAANIQREIWQEVGVFKKETPDTKAMLASMGVDKPLA